MEKSQFKRTKEEEGMRKPYEEQKIGKLNNYDEEKDSMVNRQTHHIN